MDSTSLDAVALLSYRVDMVEKNLNQIAEKILGLVPQRENDLRVQSIKEIVGDMKTDLATIKQQDLVAINKHIGDVERQITTQGETQRESMDKLQIRALTVVASSVLMLVLTFIVNYFTHFFK